MCNREDHKDVELFEDISKMTEQSDSMENEDKKFALNNEHEVSESFHEKDGNNITNDDLQLISSSDCDLEKYFTSLLQDIEKEPTRKHAKNKRFSSHGNISKGVVPGENSETFSENAGASSCVTPSPEKSSKQSSSATSLDSLTTTQTQDEIIPKSQFENTSNTSTSPSNYGFVLLDAESDGNIQKLADELSDKVIQEASLDTAVNELANKVLKKIMNEGVKIGANVEEVTTNIMRDVSSAANIELVARNRVSQRKSKSDTALEGIYKNYVSYTGKNENKIIIQELRQATLNLKDECVKMHDEIRKWKKNSNSPIYAEVVRLLHNGEKNKTTHLRTIVENLQKLASSTSETCQVEFEEMKKTLKTLEGINRRLDEKQCSKVSQNKICEVQNEEKQEVGIFFCSLLFIAFLSVIVTFVSVEDFYPLIYFIVMCIYYVYRAFNCGKKDDGKNAIP